MNNNKATDAIASSSDFLLVSRIYDALRRLEYDVVMRNTDMNKRDRYIWGEGLYETITIPDGFDKTSFNFLPRIVDIHTFQLMGRGFRLSSYYDTDDLSVYDNGSQEQKTAELTNKKKKQAAAARNKQVEAIIRDNGGFATFERGAQGGSAYGLTVFKGYWDSRAKTYRIQLLEAPQNYRAGWSDTNFRDRDYDAYVYQISPTQAYQQYGHLLSPGMAFETTTNNYPFGDTGTGNTADPLDQSTATTYPKQTEKQMVTVVDFTGILDGYTVKNGNVVQCKRGEEKPFSALVVGRYIVQLITEEKLLPRYYIINNREIPRRAYGASDLTEACLEINATYIEKMSDYITLTNKSLFPMVMAKGFELSTIPPKRQREMTIVPMDVNQTLEVVNLPQAFGFEYDKLLNELKTALIEVSGVGSILFEGAPVNSNSNAALMTQLKPVVDIVESKQKRWDVALREMFSDALEISAQHDPKLKEALGLDDYWYFRVEWPPTMRKDDPAYQQMYHNRMLAGLISFDSYLEAVSTVNVEEEKDRIKDNMKDPVIASIIGHFLPELARFTVYESLNIPLYGFNQPKITLKGDLTPEQEANIGATQGWNTPDQPFGASMGPQGLAGERANENADNVGMVTGGTQPYAKYGMPNAMDAQGNPLPMAPGPVVQGGHPGAQAPATSGTATMQPSGPSQISVGGAPTNVAPSAPGSGAPAVSPQGAINKHNQNHGR